ncbi:FlaA1/EpsC-like NDP-sugar epimerase [Mucilaginibacter yixingensis]|uniref:FlaA1/EpsC-like NDP-sugar epimerase n=1 Tax=Mucilaginibacter yixingensis TaxID=1295612 RepID=A0A2T5JGP4_9SPHI|nr:nucleoside-diphosphate sugar epimerase/dehydratase [Mucilaginibacter yixingensis]PTR01597.1 FlaA1/EpsC-like NDP-sugar epimerase [Mucilaginibacter yixingensis]
MLNRMNVAPRWIIFFLDIIFCAVSLILAHLISNNFEIVHLTYSAQKNVLITFLIINTVVFGLLKTYAGIVRFTSGQDSVRILFSVLLGNITFYLISNTGLILDIQLNRMVQVLTVNVLFSFLLLISYRLAVKYLFAYVNKLKLNQKKVIIFGANETAITTKRILDEQNTGLNMNVIAFVDEDSKKSGKKIDNVTIYPLADIEKLFSGEKIDELIIAKSDIDVNIKNTIVDVCLAHNVRVLNIPPISKWIGGHLNQSQFQNIKIEDVLEREPIQINNELIDQQINGKSILVTGAAGSIGSELVRQIIKYQPAVIILSDIAETALHELQLELQDGPYAEANFIPFIGDVRNKERMTLLFETYKPNYVYHAAAYKHVPMMENNPCEAINTNVLGTKTVADLAMRYGVEKFVMVSTDKAVNPTNVMGASKRIAEMYVQSLIDFRSDDNVIINDGMSIVNDKSKGRNRTKYITTRFGNVLGSNGSVIPRFKDQIKRGGPITVTHPEITRYFMTIPEACRLVLEAGSMGSGGEIYLFDMGKSVKIVDLAKKMIRLSGFVVDQDIKITFTGLRPGEKLYEELLNDAENTVPTHHEKIMIAKVRKQSYLQINKHINELIKLSSSFSDHNVVRKMKEIVPEYKSNNSIFEEFDVEEVPVAL